MSAEDNIKRGGLAGKMANFTPEPPRSVWNGITGQLSAGKGRLLFIFLATAAGLALMITVGVKLLNSDVEQGSLAGTTIHEDRDTRAIEDSLSGEVMQFKPTIAGSPEAVAIKKKREAIAETEGNKHGNKRTDLKEKVLLAMEEMEQDVPETMQEIVVAGLTAPETVDNSGNGFLNTASEGNSGNGKTEVDIRETVTDISNTEADFSESGLGISESESDSNVAVAEIKEVEVNEDSLLQLLNPDTISANDTEKIVKDRKWQIGASLSPLLSYRDAASPDANLNMAVNNSESPRMTYAGGVQFSFIQSDRLTIESGLYYNKMGVSIGDINSFAKGWFLGEMDFAENKGATVVNISNSMGTIVADNRDVFINNYSGNDVATSADILGAEEIDYQNTSEAKYTQSFEYLEIPFSLKYKIIDKALKVQLIGGVSTNLLVSNSITTLTENGRENIGKVQDVRSMNYSGNAGLGFIYDFPGNFSLSVEPRFRYYLNSINLNNLPSTRPYTFGIYTGLNYSF